MPETPGPFCVDISREDLSDSFNENKSAEITSIPETPLESQRTYHVLSTSDHSNVESWSNAVAKVAHLSQNLENINIVFFGFKFE